MKEPIRMLGLQLALIVALGDPQQALTALSRQTAVLLDRMNEFVGEK